MTARLIVEADGGSRGNPGPAGYGAVVRDAATGALIAERAGFLGTVTNNVAEYHGLIAGLEAARAYDPDAELWVRLDSKLLVEQMSGRWKIKHPDMQTLAIRARALVRGVTVEYSWIPREQNKAADALANEAMDTLLPSIVRDAAQASLAPVVAAPVVAAPVAPEPSFPAPATDSPEETAPIKAPARSAQASALFSVRGVELISALNLVFVRHGVTDMTVTHRLSGSSVPGPPLNAAGRVQAAQAADAVYRIGRDAWERLPSVSRVFASPMTRTQNTGAALGRRLGLPVETDARLKEIDFGQWEGMTGDEIAEAHGPAIHEWRFGRLAPPDGESIPDVGQRVNGLVEELAREHAMRCESEGDEPRTYALASHAVAIKSVVALSLKMDTTVWGSIWPQPASLTILQLRVSANGDIVERHLLCLGAPTE